MTRQKKLHRLPDQGLIAGVLAGIADYSNIDVSVARIVFVVFTFATGVFGGIATYLILAIIIPRPERTATESTRPADTLAKNAHDVIDEMQEKNNRIPLVHYLGWALIAFGLWLLFGELFPGWPILRWDIIWPAVLIVLGMLIAVKSK